MATGVVSWSQTAASNNTADSNVNWSEGQLPSTINNSARGMMSSVAKWRDDLSGAIDTGGSSTAYTVTSNQGLSLTDGVVIAFNPHTTCGATPTINVDNLGAKPLRRAPNTAFGAGDLVAGIPYIATYFSSNGGEWIVCGAALGPSNAKAWCFVNVGSSTPVLINSLNVTSVTDVGVGQTQINFTNSFAGTYTALASADSTGTNAITASVGARAVGSLVVTTYSAGVITDDINFNLAVYAS